MPLTLLHIVPRLFPQIDGVGDYALRLARELRTSHQLNSRFLVASSDWPIQPDVDGFPASRLARPNACELALALPERDGELPLLHYVGYGYQKRGVPFWLVAGIKQWMAQNDAIPVHPRRLAVMFHELWSSGLPWQSAFYLHYLQRWLAGELQRVCSVSATSTPRMRDLITDAWPRHTELLPIPSNFPVNEQGQQRSIQRPLRVLIFGQTGTRLPALKAHASLLEKMRAQGLIESIIVAGHGSAPMPNPSPDVAFLASRLPDIPMKVLGEVAPHAASRVFLEAGLVLSFYPSSLACKSATFATALACGCPVVVQKNDRPDPLEVDRHFLTCDGSPAQIGAFCDKLRHDILNHVSAEGRAWYFANAHWPMIARRFATLLTHIH